MKIAAQNFLLFFSFLLLFACGQNEKIDEKNNSEPEKDKIIVKTEKVIHRHFQHSFIANGSVEAIRAAFISPEMNGQIKAIHVNEGQRVQVGQLLITLNGSVLENSIKEAQTGLELAATMFKKQEELWKQKIGSEVQYLQAKSNKEQLETKIATLKSQLDMTRIHAPFSGIIDKITLKKGELASPGMQLIQLVDLSEIYINADVSESYLPHLSKGDSVTVTFPTYPDLKVKTTIHRIGSVINTQNRTFQVQLKTKNIGEKLKPNLMANVEMNDFVSDNAILVPSITIKKDLQGEYVFTVKQSNGKNTAEKKYIKSSLSSSDKTLIEKGLTVGDLIIVEGYNLVKSGMEVNL